MPHAFIHHNGIHHQYYPPGSLPALPEGSYLYQEDTRQWYEICFSIPSFTKPEEIPLNIRAYLLLVI